MDVQRRDRHATAARSPALTGEDPLALVRIAGVVEAAGEHVVVAEPGPDRVLIPRRPWNGPPSAREVDRRRLTILPLVEVQRSPERGLALERPPTVPMPRVVHAPAANERENTWS